MNIFSLFFILNYVNGNYIFTLNRTKKRNLDIRDEFLKNHSLDTSGIYGNSSSLYYYYVNIYIGTPVKRQSLIIDTGSSLMGIPCKSFCRSCGKHLNSYYDINDSQTSSLITCKNSTEINLKCDFCLTDECRFSQSYGEGSSYSGKFIKDEISFGDSYHIFDSLDTPIGCIESETNLFYTQDADGILGLAPNNDRFEHIISYLHRNKRIKKKLFSLCFANNGGYFALGGINHTFHIENEIKYVDIIPDSFYKINLMSIKLDYDEYKINDEYSTIIDSGTTVTYFPSDLYSQFIERIKLICNGKDKNKCKGSIQYKNSDLCIDQRSNTSLRDFFDSLPTIQFKFNKDILIKWNPEDYLTLINYNTYCIGINSWGYNNLILVAVKFFLDQRLCTIKILYLIYKRIKLALLLLIVLPTVSIFIYRVNGFTKIHQSEEQEQNCELSSNVTSKVPIIIISVLLLISLGILLYMRKRKVKQMRSKIIID